MKNMSFAILLAAAIALTGESSVVYRGRLVNAENPQAVCPFEPGATKAMTFTVYDGAANRVCDIMQDVPIEANGLFTVILDDPQLQAAVANGTATEIGLRIGNAKAEVYPRRKLLPTPRAETAARAAGLAKNATVGTLSANGGTVQNFRANGDLNIEKGIRSADGKPVKGLTYRILPSKDTPVNINGTGSVFGKAMNLTSEYGRSEELRGTGEQITTAPEDGVATIVCTDSLPYERYDFPAGAGPKNTYMGCGSPCCSTVVFCKRGDPICVPSGWECLNRDNVREKRHFAVRFHPFIKR